MPSPTSTGMVIGDPGSLRQLEYQGDTGNASWFPRVSYGSTGFFTIRASGLSTATVTSNTGFSTGSADFVSPPWARGAQFYFDVSAGSTTLGGATSGNVTIGIEIQAKDPLSGDYVSMSSGGWMFGTSSGVVSSGNQISGVSTGAISLQIYPGIITSTGRTYNGTIPGQYKVQTTFSGSSYTVTWSISGQYEP